MSALAGLWRFGGASNLVDACGLMLDAQRAYARLPARLHLLGEAAIGSASFPQLPEDRFDRQPYVDSEANHSLVADVRIDNRAEILAALAIPSGAELSDAELLHRAYGRWRHDSWRRIDGDFAIAVWDGADRSLTLVRDRTGQRPLHYHVGTQFAAFASMAAGLHAVPEIERACEPSQLAFFLADIPSQGEGTFFRGISRVEPGHVVTITRSNVSARPYWEMPETEVRFKDEADYAEGLREHLDRATRSRLRGSERALATHLSAGLDSSAVTATAARIAPGSKVLAITSAPRPGFSGPLPVQRIGDESAYAALTAAMYPNIEHLVLRPAGLPLLEAIQAEGSFYPEPVGHPCNHTWWSAANAAAKERGFSVMLTGEAGNLTISAGGISVLADFIKTGRWGSWWREARTGLRSNGWRWRGVLAASFAPALPSAVAAGLRKIASAKAGIGAGAALLKPEWRERLRDWRADHARGLDLESSRRLRWKLLQSADPGNFRKSALARWGVDERDPTSDRRLAEFCLSLPPDQLLRAGVDRRLARLAFADRLPGAVLDAPRGYQYADWYKTIDRASLAARIDDLERRIIDNSVIDFEALRRLASSWPERGFDSLSVIVTYRIILLRALAAAAFVSSACQ